MSYYVEIVSADAKTVTAVFCDASAPGTEFTTKQQALDWLKANCGLPQYRGAMFEVKEIWWQQ
jgi:hypothetical protein